MIRASDAFIEAVNGNGRMIHVSLAVNGTAFDGDIYSVKITRGACGQRPEPGSIFVPYVELEVQSTALDFNGAMITLKIGVCTNQLTDAWEQVNAGTYEVSRSDIIGNSKTRIKAIGSLGTVGSEAASVTSTNFSDIISQASNATGKAISLVGLTAVGSFTEIPTGTWRDVLAEIAFSIGGFLTENVNGGWVIAAYCSGSEVEIGLDRMQEPPVYGQQSYTLAGVQVESAEVNMSMGNPLLDPWDYLAVEDYVESNFMILPSSGHLLFLNPKTQTGNMSMAINSAGHLIYTKDDTVTVDFSINGGHLRSAQQPAIKKVPCLQIAHTIAGYLSTSIIAEVETEAEEAAAVEGPVQRQISETKAIAESAQSVAREAQETADEAKAAAEVSVTSDTLHYLATDKSSGVTTSTSGWTTSVQQMTQSKPYLWTYHTYARANGTTFNSSPVITGAYGKDGTSVTILGSYNTFAELQAAHPTGAKGDSYMVADDLYVWNGSAWENVGQIRGPAGPQGPQGLQGIQGAQGVSVTKIQPQYYLSTSSTSATGGSWSNSMTYTAGKFIWTREQITYSNNTTGYSTAVYNAALTTACSSATGALAIAGNTDQHFWFTSSGTDTGAHITEAKQDDFLVNPYNGGSNLLLRSTGMAIRRGLTELAKFAANGIELATEAFSNLARFFVTVDEEGRTYGTLSLGASDNPVLKGYNVGGDEVGMVMQSSGSNWESFVEASIEGAYLHYDPNTSGSASGPANSWNLGILQGQMFGSNPTDAFYFDVETTSAIASVITASSAASITGVSCSRWGKIAMIEITWTNKSAITVPASGNISNVTVGTIKDGWKPATRACAQSLGDSAGAAWYNIGTGGVITLGAVEGTGAQRTIAAGTTFHCNATFILAKYKLTV